MSEAKHTPGPWKLTELPWECDGQSEPIYRVDGESTLFLSVAPCSDGYVPGQNEANAHLIAAAPDLLAACEAVLAVLGFMTESGNDAKLKTKMRALGWDGTGSPEHFSWRFTEKAVAKARGANQ